MNSLLAFSLILSVLVLLSVSESYAQSSEFIISRSGEKYGAGAIAGQSDDPSVATVDVNIDALSLPAMNLTVFGETIRVTHEETYHINAEEYVYVGSTDGSKDNVYVGVVEGTIRLELDRLGPDYILDQFDSDYKIVKKTIRTLGTTGEEPAGITLIEDISDITIIHTEVKRTFAIFESEDSEISFKVLAGSNVASIKDKGDGVITIIIDPKRAHIGSHEVIIGATAGQKSTIASFTVTVLDADTR